MKSIPSTHTPAPIHPQVRVGHVHLKVADLERSLAFYRDVLGFEVTQRFGAQAVFLSAGGYHHHLGLNTWESAGGRPPAPGTTGLYHAAFLYPTRATLADALRRLLAAGIPLDGAADHGVSEALCLRGLRRSLLDEGCRRRVGVRGSIVGQGARGLLGGVTRGEAPLQDLRPAFRRTHSRVSSPQIRLVFHASQTGLWTNSRVVTSTKQVGASEAKTTLPALLAQVSRGREIVITTHARPIARVAPVATPGSHDRTVFARIRALRPRLPLAKGRPRSS